MKSLLKKLVLFSAGHTYSNLSRLFLRLFVGVMFLHICTQQLMHLSDGMPQGFDGFLGMSAGTSMTALLVMEVICAACIMFGFMTRYAVLPPLVMMCMAENIILQANTSQVVSVLNFQPGYPIMFIGIFLYILLAGPGKISLDYIIAVHLVDQNEENDIIERA